MAKSAWGIGKWVVLSAAIVGGAVALAALGMRFLRPQVIVSEVVEAPVVQAFYSTGTIEPEREFPIKSNTAGILTAVNVDKGDRVTKGQDLAVVTEPALIYAHDRARAELEEKLARADTESSPVLQEFDARIDAFDALLQIAGREQKRVTDMLESNSASQADLDRAIDRVKTVWSELESLKAQRQSKRLELVREVEVARSALRTAEWDLDQQTLRAPIDGVVLDRPTSIGTRVAVNDRLMRIADVSPARLVVRAAVDEEDIVKVRPDQTVRLTLYALPGEVLTGRVTRIYDEADPNRRTFEVDVELTPPDERVAPGMTGELAFIMASKDRARVVPSQAAQDGAVWLVRNGRLARTSPRLGLASVERVEVLSGLAPGDQVVISPIGTLAEGQPVRTRWMDPAEAAGLNKVELEEQPFKAFD